MGIRLGNAFQCQKVLYPKHEQEEPSLLCIKQPNSGTSTSSTLGFLRRNLQHCSRECRRTARSRKINYGIWINHMGSIYITGNNKTGEYSKKGSQVHSQTQQEITKLENIQRRGARFIAKDYKSREEGCMTKMLNELCLPALQSRRQKKRLNFFY